MPRFSWVITACLAFALGFSGSASASSCAVGGPVISTNCRISGQSGSFTWALSDIQITAANVNVNPSDFSLSGAAWDISGAGQLQLTEQVTTPASAGLAHGMPVIINLAFDLSVISSAPSQSGPTPPHNAEAQTYLDGLLLGTVGQRTVPSVPGVTGTFLDQETTIAVDEIFIVGGNSGTNTFSESFDIADPQSGSGPTPPSTPEPAAFGLFAFGASLVCLSGMLPRIKRYFTAS